MITIISVHRSFSLTLIHDFLFCSVAAVQWAVAVCPSAQRLNQQWSLLKSSLKEAQQTSIYLGCSLEGLPGDRLLSCRPPAAQQSPAQTGRTAERGHSCRAVRLCCGHSAGFSTRINYDDYDRLSVKAWVNSSPMNTWFEKWFRAKKKDPQIFKWSFEELTSTWISWRCSWSNLCSVEVS